ncbi:MAGUK p55 subfamily member 2 [Columba livia]|uniref:MAGUK p55 subfamily member 2 n=1 Tax=Columba livia TaxID=8932 RepID=A0A2I0LNU3_COLLI|nr:MAGUK p55 subfamily member 2 [Columba livia]
MQQVLDNLMGLPGAPGAADLDLIFLRGIMESPIVRSLAKAHERLEETKLEAVGDNNVELVQEILRDIGRMVGIRKVAGENLGVTFRVERGELVIARILHGGMVAQQGLLHVGDVIRGPCPLASPPLVSPEPHAPLSLCPWPLHTGRDSSRARVPVAGGTLVSLWGHPAEVAPVLSLSPCPQQDLGGKGCLVPPPSPCRCRCHPGDKAALSLPALALPVPALSLWHPGAASAGQGTCVQAHACAPRGVRVHHAPARMSGIVCAVAAALGACVCAGLGGGLCLGVFVKCHFDYDPASDSLIPCKEAGLRFCAGDLLQIVNQDDPNWWQACHVEGGSAGLVPSQLLEEKRKAFVRRDAEMTPASGALCGSLSGKRKKRMMYLTTKNAEFDRHELLIYEEVARMPPFRRKTLVLIGAQGVGRRSLKNKLIMSDQARYGTTIPYTSRKPKESEKDGHGYRFVSRGEMEADIRAGRYLEHGEYEGNLYGTKIDSIRAVVEAGKMCILDVNPQAVKVLRTAEFVPYVVFIEGEGPSVPLVPPSPLPR